MTDKTIKWIAQQKLLAPDKPFFIYYAPGATHAPHHVAKEWADKYKEWADKYKSKFDQGWDKVREETFARQKKLGVVPADCQLTARPKEVPAWDAMPEAFKPALRREMEVYAGYMEFTDHNVGRVVDTLEKLNILDDTLIYYIVGDNGASAEGGINGSFNEMSYFNGLQGLETAEYLTARIDKLGRPVLIQGKTQLLVGGMGRLSENCVLNIKNKSHSITAEIVVPENGAEGVIICQGANIGGWTLYAHKGKLKYCYNWGGFKNFMVEAKDPLPAGQHQVRMEFAYAGGGLGKGGKVTLYTDGKKVGEANVEATLATIFSADDGTDVGEDSGAAISPDYGTVGNHFNGEVKGVQLSITDDPNNSDHLVKPEDAIRAGLRWVPTASRGLCNGEARRIANPLDLLGRNAKTRWGEPAGLERNGHVAVTKFMEAGGIEAINFHR